MIIGNEVRRYIIGIHIMHITRGNKYIYIQHKVWIYMLHTVFQYLRSLSSWYGVLLGRGQKTFYYMYEYIIRIARVNTYIYIQHKVLIYMLHISIFAKFEFLIRSTSWEVVWRHLTICMYCILCCTNSSCKYLQYIYQQHTVKCKYTIHASKLNICQGIPI